MSLFHRKHYRPDKNRLWYEWHRTYETVDDMIDWLTEEHALFEEILGQHRRDLAAIHAAYRAQYCSDCCHDAICEKKASIKYGDKCEAKEVNCPKRMMP